MLAASFGAGQVAYSLLWFFLFLAEIWLMLSVFIDIFRSHDLRGWIKALWVIFVLVVPLFGILAYLIVRGDRMRAHQLESWQSARSGQHGPWGQQGGGFTGSGPSQAPPRSAHDVVDSLHRLADLRDRGEISAEQYRRLRAQLLDEDESA